MADTEYVISPSTMVGQHNVTLPTYGDGKPTIVQTDDRGRVFIITDSLFPITVKGTPYSATASVTRPNNTTPYDANDVIGPTGGVTGALTFTDIGPSAGGEVMITTVFLEIDIAAVPTGMTSFTLYLYGVTPPSALADGVTFNLPSGDRSTFRNRGLIALGTPVDLGDTLYVEVDAYNKQITVPAGGIVYGYLVTTGGYTPAASSVFTVGLKSVLL